MTEGEGTGADPLPLRLRALLEGQARLGETISYREVAARLDLVPPGVIGRVGAALEVLMAQDAAAGRPLLAALCVSRLDPGLPRRGFFDMAARLGLFSGDPDGPEARVFHAHELSRLLADRPRT